MKMVMKTLYPSCRGMRNLCQQDEWILNIKKFDPTGSFEGKREANAMSVGQQFS